MKDHHLLRNLVKTELIVPATPHTQHDFSIQLGSSTITQCSSVRNLGVILDDQLSFIASTAPSCRSALFNISKSEPSSQILLHSSESELCCSEGWTPALLFQLVSHPAL